MKVKRSDLRRILKPIVKEMVQETIEDILLEDNYLRNKIQESVLQGEVISHVISEVFKGFGGGVISETRQRPPQQQSTLQQTQSQPQVNVEELRHNPELEQDLNKRSSNLAAQIGQKVSQQNSSDKVRQQYSQRQREARQPQQGGNPNRQINWRSLQNVQLPPDSDDVGMQQGGKMNLQEAANAGHFDPLGGVQGDGIDLGIIEAMTGERGLWDRDKMNRFMSMADKKWQKKELDLEAREQQENS